jgi:hypothetical protein
VSASIASPATERLARYVTHELPRRVGLQVRQVSWEGSTQLVLDTRYELRGVRYRLAPGIRRSEPTPKPDPWSCDLRDPDDLVVPGEIARKLPGTSVYIDCFACRASGESPCDGCTGTGMVFQGAGDRLVSVVCDGCQGRGRARCAECLGSGGLDGEATVWSRIGTHEEIRSIRGRQLPADVVAALTLSSQRGDVIHHLEGRRLDELVLPVGYRDSAAAAEVLLETARNLCASPGIEPSARVLHQVLEVRRVPVARLRMEDESELWCWGDPPKLWPSLRRRSPWRQRLVVGFTVACAVAGALVAASGR